MNINKTEPREGLGLAAWEDSILIQLSQLKPTTITMNVHRIKELSPEERRVTLEGECFRVEEQSYMKPLTEQELMEYRADFSQSSIEVSMIKDELKEIQSSYKAKLEPLQKKISTDLSAIKQRGLWTKGKVYLMPDHESRVMHVVSEDGVVIDSRMMKPEERQLTIHHNQAAV